MHLSCTLRPLCQLVSTVCCEGQVRQLQHMGWGKYQLTAWLQAHHSVASAVYLQELQQCVTDGSDMSHALTGAFCCTISAVFLQALQEV